MILAILMRIELLPTEQFPGAGQVRRGVQAQRRSHFLCAFLYRIWKANFDMVGGVVAASFGQLVLGRIDADVSRSKVF